MDLMQTKSEVLDIVKPGNSLVIVYVGSENTKKGIKISSFSSVKIEVNDDFSLTEKDVLDVPCIKHTKADEKKYFKKIMKFMGNNPWLGYDSGFDFRMLFEMAERTGKKFEQLPSLSIVNMAMDFFHKPEIRDYSFNTVKDILNIDLSEVLMVNDLKNMFEAFVQKYVNYFSEEMLGLAVTKARLSYNTITKSGKKIVVSINGIKDKMVYYDAETSEWFVDSTVKQKIYLPYIIKQIENMYILPAGKTDIDELADMWFASSERLLAKKTKRTKKKA